MAQKKHSATPPRRRRRGFEPAAKLVATRVQNASEGRGFAVTRLLTHWPEVAGEQLAAITRPVKISHSKGGFGATLTLLTIGPVAPMVEMQLPELRDKVNACYGYNAIARILLTQTAPQGFADGQASFAHKPAAAKPAPRPADLERASEVAGQFDDPDLARAMRQLALNHADRQIRKR